MSNFQIISPTDKSVFLEQPFATPQEIQSALKQAKQAQNAWGALSLAERKHHLETFLNLLKKDEAQMAQEITEQMGRPISQAPGELAGMHHRAQYLLQISEQALASIDADGALSASKTPYEVERYIEKTPLGVILIIAPWNYPYLTVINSLMPALLAGNTVLLKHAPQTFLCGQRLHKAAQQSLPPGVMQHVMMPVEAIETLMAQGEVDGVNFTGSVEVGKMIHAQASRHMIKTNLELGGKDAAYVTKEADIDFSARQLVDGAFFNAGQSCCSIERIYVHQSVYQDFCKAFESITSELVLGDPMDPKTTLGPVANQQIYQKATKQVMEAEQEGCEVVRFHEVPKTSGYYFPATILYQSKPHMSVMREESFAPLVCIIPVDSDEQALEQMNDSDFGLSASVWSKNTTQAKRLLAQLKVGTAFLNQCDYLDPALAWTGCKLSGLGLSLSILGFDAFIQPKSFYLRKEA